MNIEDYFKYSLFSTLSYVDWSSSAWGQDVDSTDAANQAIFE